MPKNITKLIFELGQLRRIKHEGMRLAGVEYPESVAEHSLRAAQIGFFLAKMEKWENPYEVVTIIAFHDMGECRVGDIHKVANAYVEADEKGAVKDQLENIEDGEEIYSLWSQMEDKSTVPGVIAKDADYLEQAFSAKEYVEKGYKRMEDWMKNVKNHLQTKSAKLLFDEMVKMESTDWWKDLKKI